MAPTNTVFQMTTYRVTPAEVDSFLAAADATRILSRRCGCTRYEIYRNPDEPAMFFELAYLPDLTAITEFEQIKRRVQENFFQPVAATFAAKVAVSPSVETAASMN